MVKNARRICTGIGSALPKIVISHLETSKSRSDVKAKQRTGRRACDHRAFMTSFQAIETDSSAGVFERATVAEPRYLKVIGPNLGVLACVAALMEPSLYAPYIRILSQAL